MSICAFFSFFYKIFHNHSFKSFDMGVLDGHWVTFSTCKLHFRISMYVVLTFSAKVLVFKVLTVLQVNSWWPPPRECKTAKRTKSPYLKSKTTINRTEIFQCHVFMIKKLPREEHFHQGMHFGVRWSQYLGRKRKITICVENQWKQYLVFM